MDKFSSSDEFSARKKNVKDNLISIADQISRNKLFKKYQILSNQKKNEKNKAEMILQPSRSINIENIVKCWNESLEKDETDKDHQFIFENAEATNTISKRNFTRYSAYARMNLLLSDKNRQGTYQFKFKDYRDRIPVYFPPGYSGFNELPEGYNAFLQQNDAEPTMWIINLSGIQ